MQWKHAKPAHNERPAGPSSPDTAPVAPASAPAHAANAANANDRRETRLASLRFVDDWRAAQPGAVLVLSEIPVGGLDLAESSHDRIECTGCLDAANFDRAIAELSRVLRQEGVAVIGARLGHNPIARFNRKRRLVQGDPVRFEAAAPLTCAHLDRLRAHFGGVDVQTFDIFAFALAALEAALGRLHPALRTLCTPLWPLCRKLDAALLRRQSLRRYGCTAVAVLKWPRRHERD